MTGSSEPHDAGNVSSSGQHPTPGPPADQPADQPVGQHRLGPHVVGQRIVLRRLLPGRVGPTGGPAMTDLLGTCTAWGDGVCEIVPDGPGGGEPVRVRLSEIVSGKPVPPRASARHRVGAREAELHVLALFPGLETQPLGEWLLRHDPDRPGRPRKRANSCLALGDPGTSYAEAATAVRDFYASRDRPPLAQVEAGSEAEAALGALGWTPLPHGQAELRLASLAQLRRRRAAVRGAARGAAGADPGPAELTVDGDQARVTLHGGAGVIARGSASLDGDWLALHDIQVATEHRRRGLAGQVLDELCEWGAERGASTVWLHVETDNAPALGFYDRLGLEPHHTCRYLSAPS